MARKSSSGTLSFGSTKHGSKSKVSYADLEAMGVNMTRVMVDFLKVHGAEGIRAMTASVNQMAVPDNHFDTVENLEAIEEAKSAFAAKQADHAVAYEDALAAERLSRRQVEKNPGWGASKDVALALRISPRKGTEFTNSARILRDDLPLTHQALREGRLSWAQALVVIGGTRHLHEHNRQLIDELLWDQVNNTFDQGTALLSSKISFWALQLEPKTEESLEEKALERRNVCGYQINAHEILIKGIFPLAMGVAMLQALTAIAAAAKNQANEKRTIAQIQADTLHEMVTGTKSGGVGVEILLVMDATVLSGQSDEPVLLPGYGPITAKAARKLVSDNELITWVRALYLDSRTGKLVAMKSKAREFGGNLKKLIMVRDQYCRTPHCNNKIREIDHIVQVRSNGKTSAKNGDGRCRSCNMTKEAPGWEEKPMKGQRHSFQITTPSGHTYISQAPPLPGTVMSGYPKAKLPKKSTGGSPPKTRTPHNV